MKPRKLILQAFGPYAHRQELDFTTLSDQAFFLIHGPTGAGKTTILDGISFALYGQTSGGLREAKDMRSHFADPNLETVVIFEFQIHDRRYRVERSPEQKVPKAKGEGFKCHKAWANLFELRGDHPEPLAQEKLSLVNERLERLLGFKADQFRQVVLLPQGRFQEFMLSDSAQRQSLLQALFQTERYATITQNLSLEEKALSDEITFKRDEIQAIKDQMAVQSVSQAEELFHTRTLRIEALQSEQKSCQARLEQATQALQEGHEARRHFKEKAEAEEALDRLQSQRQLMNIRKTELDQARRAQGVLPIVQNLQDSLFRSQELQARREALQKDVRDAEEQVAQCVGDMERAKDSDHRRQELLKSIERLKDLEPRLQSLESKREEVRKSIQIKAQLELELDKLDFKREKSAKEYQDIQERHTALQQEAIQGEARERLHALARQQRNQRDELERYYLIAKDALTAYEEAESHALDLKGKREKAKNELSLLLDKRHQAQAVLLSGQLQDGEPCPVCGSAEHPFKATGGTELPDEARIHQAQDQVNTLETLYNQAMDVLHQRHGAYERDRARTEVLQEALGEYAKDTAEAFMERESEARSFLEKSREAERLLSSLDIDFQQARARQEGLDAEAGRLQQRLEGVKLEEAAHKAQVRLMEESLLSELKAPGALSTRLEQAEQELKRLDEALERASQAHQEALQHCAEAKARLDAHRETLEEAEREQAARNQSLLEALKAHRFRDLQSFELAKRSPEDMEELEKVVQDFESQFQASTERLQRALESTQGLMPPDIDALTKELEKTQKQLNHHSECLGRLESENALFLERLGALKEKWTHLEQREARFHCVARMARAARGESGNHLAFERYVQGIVLDQVLRIASERLLRMSNGRYALHRDVASENLDLSVSDAHTGQQRSVNTLSGGEAFQASLALALGLSDVVQRHANGIRLETVFIDEGFGSLDPEALDLALRTLQDLQQGGRLVGLISHLEEVKARIPARLEVIPGPGGSRAVFQVG